MAHSDARKHPWYLDLTPSEMEEVIRAVPALLVVALGADEALKALPFITSGSVIHIHGLQERIDALTRAHPDWRTWLVVEQEGR